MLFLFLFAAAAAPSLRAQTLSSPQKSAEFPVGGLHEFGGYVGHSWNSGPQLGYVRNTKFTTVVARYSYRIKHYDSFDIRYAPEVTLFANLFEPLPSPNNIHPGGPFRSFGGGISPAGFQGVFLTRRRVEPFINLTGGVINYNQPVLSDGGTAFMFTVDYGTGMNIFLTPRVATTIGFRYQHQSNANTGMHNPGTDAELFYVGFSHFHTKGVR